MQLLQFFPCYHAHVVCIAIQVFNNCVCVSPLLRAAFWCSALQRTIMCVDAGMCWQIHRAVTTLAQATAQAQPRRVLAGSSRSFFCNFLPLAPNPLSRSSGAKRFNCACNFLHPIVQYAEQTHATCAGRCLFCAEI